MCVLKECKRCKEEEMSDGQVCLLIVSITNLILTAVIVQ